MDENINTNENGNVPEGAHRNWKPLWVAAVVVLCTAAVAVAIGLAVRQQNAAAQLSARNQELTASLTQTKGQIQTLSSELSNLQKQEAERAERERVESSSRHAAVLHREHLERLAAAKKLAAHKDDPRWKQVQSELADHQSAITSNQQDLLNAQEQFSNSLNTTRNQLSSSIARTHAELVKLEREGERNYFEFDMFKNKRFHRVGPIEVSLRKTNAKHQFCNLHVIVDDRELVKKHINVYQPVVFYTQKNGQPLQLVINNIERHHIHGYVSAPKYQQGHLSAANNVAASGAGASGATGGQPPVLDLSHRPVR